MPSGSGKALLFIRRNSHSRGYVFSCVLPSFFSARDLSALLLAEPPPPGEPLETCAPQAAWVGTSLGHQTRTAQGVPPGQEFPAELICPQGHLAATQCHLCLQTTRSHHRQIIPDTEWDGHADATSPNSSGLICELKTQIQQRSCARGEKDKFLALSTIFWKENKQRHQPWGRWQGVSSRRPSWAMGAAPGTAMERPWWAPGKMKPLCTSFLPLLPV